MMTATIHPFEGAGLGLAPFRFAGLSEKVYCACPGAPVQAAGSCDYCGTGIRYCCHIRSADGKEFIVGTDCVRKLDRADNRLVSDVDRAVANLEKAKRDAKRQAEWDARAKAREAACQAERDRNGGLTDREVAEQKRREEEAATTLAMTAKNGWLIDVLARVPYESGFVAGILQDLTRRDAGTFGDRCLSILADIYAKGVSGARRNSAAHKAAESEFWTKVEKQA